MLVEEHCQHEAATWAALSAASSLAGRQPRHEVVLPNFLDAKSRRIQATCELLVAPLDAILTDIEREDIHSAARAKESAALAFATRLQHCWRRPTNTVTTRRLHKLWSLRPSHLQRGAITTRLRRRPCCPQQALSRMSKAAMRALTERLLW